MASARVNEIRVVCLGLCGRMQYRHTGEHVRTGANHSWCNTQLHPYQLFGLLYRYGQNSCCLRQSDMCFRTNPFGLQEFTSCKFILSFIQCLAIVLLYDTPININKCTMNTNEGVQLKK